MDTFTSRNINWAAAFKTTPLSKRTHEHLSQVYSYLTVALGAAAVGVWAFQHLYLNTFLVLIGQFACMYALYSTPQELVSRRVGILSGFAFLSGMNMAPLVWHVAHVDPSIVLTAFVGTSCIFASFTAASLMSARRSWLLLGGFLGSALSAMLALSLLNLFFRSVFVHNIMLYGGLVVFSGFVVFDTQLIAERAETGHSVDAVADALTLFLDFINIFIRVLIILSKDKKKENNNSSRR